ncbi:hypothetical protein NUW54_g5042 [Trametes sanguinea]|uniref:Uncharacterized protein n=1 Tax=Trametes sanguinea TaxID=158606 RepID=A0ACC1PXV2_9APHY|nr:hypothetical protein NUW54_g5042 [Trametes sanguinea]
MLDLACPQPHMPAASDDRASAVVQGTTPSEERVDDVKETPLPKLQLFILLYLQLAEPITSTVIYPFVNQLVRETGITHGDERKTGYFAGLIVRRRPVTTLCSDWLPLFAAIKNIYALWLSCDPCTGLEGESVRVPRHLRCAHTPRAAA